MFYNYDYGVLIRPSAYMAKGLPDSELLLSFIMFILHSTESRKHCVNLCGSFSAVPKRINDLLWLTWSHGASLASKSPTNLNHFVSEDVINASTIAVVDSIMARLGHKLQKWPGQHFDMNSDEGKALLGTPNALSLGWMLIYNLGTFKKRTVESVNVFLDEVGRLILCFNIGPLK